MRLIEYQDDRPDALGRRHFALFWKSGDKLRAQHFFAKPEDYAPHTMLDVRPGEDWRSAACRMLGVRS